MKTEQYNLRLSSDLLEQARIKAKAESLSVSELIRRSMELYISGGELLQKMQGTINEIKQLNNK